MIYYASRTGTLRNLDAIRAAGFRLLISRAGTWRTHGFPYGLDNGAWTDANDGRPFDDAAFLRLLAGFGAGADWVVVPDIVAGGRASLDLSLEWLPRCRDACPVVLIAAQDGIEPRDLEPLVGPTVGVFLGGSTDWKLARMSDFGRLCRGYGAPYHVGRVNTAKRLFQAAGAFATSADGTSATRYAKTVPLLRTALSSIDPTRYPPPP